MSVRFTGRELRVYVGKLRARHLDTWGLLSLRFLHAADSEAVLKTRPSQTRK